MPFLPIILAVVAIGGLFVYLGWKAAKERREALAALARELGWTFDPGRDRSHDDEYAHFEIFRRGHSRVGYNTLRGRIEIEGHDAPIKMGDFLYKVTTGSGKHRRTQTYRFSYVIAHLPHRRVPPLLIRPEGVFDKVAGVFGFDDIDFESAEFSRRFYVRSVDKRFAYDVVHPRMMEFLLADPPPAIDIEHGRCCLSDGRTRWKPEEFKGVLQWMQRFFDLWPEHVKEKLKAEN